MRVGDVGFKEEVEKMGCEMHWGSWGVDGEQEGDMVVMRCARGKVGRVEGAEWFGEKGNEEGLTKRNR